MATTTKKTTIEYPVDEFVNLLKAQFFGNYYNNLNVKFIIKEVGGDYLDRYPGEPQVVAVQICYEENLE